MSLIEDYCRMQFMLPSVSSLIERLINWALHAGIGGLLYMSRRNEGLAKRIRWQRERGAALATLTVWKQEWVRRWDSFLRSGARSMECEPWGHAFSPHIYPRQPHSLYLRVQCVFIHPVEYLNNRWNNIYFNTESNFWKRFLVLQNTFSFK